MSENTAGNPIKGLRTTLNSTDQIMTASNLVPIAKNKPPLSPETIEVIREELKSSIAWCQLPIADQTHLNNLQQAQAEFNKVYGGGE